MNKRIRIGKKQDNTGVMDFSYLLDAPAGKHGFITERDGHFYFEDGTRGKFVGFNLPTRANMPDHHTADVLSTRFASMGVNVIRVHAADAPCAPRGWSCRPGYSIINYDDPTGPLNPAGLERLDYFIACLREKGIYIHMDLLVARQFTDKDGLDYEGDRVWPKLVGNANRRLIELQKDYATKLLTHVNPYTGLAYKDDPAVMTVQIVNENSVFYTFGLHGENDSRKPYFEELCIRFNHFLRAKYAFRRDLEAAWTVDGISTLEPDEDPEMLTVKMPPFGELTQPFCHPMASFDALSSPARYADFMDFLMGVNRSYYREMYDHLRALGVRVPINTSNMCTGPADYYSSMGDVTENNAYFNHPCPGPDPEHYLYSPHMREYVSTDPRTSSFASMEPRSHILTQFAPGHMENKPFIMTEWNEYGEYPFHASAFLSTAAYACLQDIDGLIIYTYHTFDDLDLEAEDEIRDIMDTFNDPSLMLQFGTMSAVFLQGLIKKAPHKVDVVYTENDLHAFPETHRMPFTVLPFITGVRSVYPGYPAMEPADAALSAGFMSAADLTREKHGILYAYSPYLDAARKSFMGERYFDRHEEAAAETVGEGITLGERYLKIRDLKAVLDGFDCTEFAKQVDAALKKWNIIGEETGIDEKNAMISETGELRISPYESRFTAYGEAFSFYAGKPEECITFADRFVFRVKNERIALSMITSDGKPLAASLHLLVNAIGRSGMDGAVYEQIPDSPKLPETEVTRISKEGKLYMETVEGKIEIRKMKKDDAEKTHLYALDVYGARLREITGSYDASSETIRYELDGEYAGNFEILM